MCCSKSGGGGGRFIFFFFGGLSFVHVCPFCHSVRVPSCKCGRGDEVKGTPLTLALLAASTLYVGSRRARRALRGGAGDGLTLHRAVLVRRGERERGRERWRSTAHCQRSDFHSNVFFFFLKACSCFRFLELSDYSRDDVNSIMRDASSDDGSFLIMRNRMNTPGFIPNTPMSLRMYTR